MPSAPEINVGFHIGANSGLKRVVDKNRPIIRHLLQKGASVYYTNHGVAYENGAFETAHSVVETQGEFQEQAQDLVELAAIRDLTGHLDVDTPTINEPEVIDLARNKGNFYALFPDVTATAVVFDTQKPQSLSAVLEQLPGYVIVVKPIVGAESKDVQVTTKKDLKVYLLDELVRRGGQWLIQSFLPNLTLSHSGVIPLDEESGELMKVSTKAELRLHTTTSGEPVPTSKVWPQGVAMSEYVYAPIDPDKLPEPAYLLARYCVARLNSLAGNPGRLWAAVDMIYSGQENAFEGWQIMEANVKEPSVPRHPVVGGRVGEMVAKELLKP